MSLNNNAVKMRIEDREKMFRHFRKIHGRLDELVEAMEHSGLYTVKEFEQFATEYHILEPKADRLEENIRKYYPAKNLDDVISWMKSNPLDDWNGEEEIITQEPNWDMDEAELFGEPTWGDMDVNEDNFLQNNLHTVIKRGA